LDRIRDQDRITTMEAAVKDHVNRLFSVEDEDASPGKDSGHGSTNSSTDKVETRETDSVLETDPVPDSKVCGKLCTMIKCQLIKSHEEVVRRFGHLGTSPPALPDTEPPTEDMEDQETINALVARGLAELEFPSGGSNIFTKTWSSPTDADKVDAAPREEGTTSSLTTTVSTDMVSCPGGSHNVEELKSPTTPGGPVDLASVLSPGSFQMVESVPVTHKFKLTIFQPNNMKNFMKHVKKEMRLLQTSLPPGIIVKGYEERMDLFSVMIHGPKNTPYEDGLFFFDFQLPANYPYEPPAAHYISYCSDRLNPNLYEDGKVCVSLLGTWQGKGTETWTQDSNLLQLLVSIQGLILVREPYFNEAGYEKQRGAQQGNENSRMYNEMAVLKLVQSMTKLARNPQVPFQEEIQQHFQENGKKLTSRLLRWKAVSLEHMESLASTPTTPGTSTKASQGLDMPDFPLVPASKGFCLTLDKAIQNFQSALEAIVVSKMELSLD